jgi:hypothetical protein
MAAGGCVADILRVARIGVAKRRRCALLRMRSVLLLRL